MPVFRAYPQANSINTTDAFVLDRIGQGTMFVEGLNLVANAPYVVSLELLGTPPLSNEIIGIHTFPVAVTFAQGLSNMVLYADAAPTSNQTVNVYKIHNGAASLLGTWTATASSKIAFTTTLTTSISFVVGDAIRHIAQGSDATWENISWSMVGAITP